MNNIELAGAVTTLHNIARLVENQLGVGDISKAIRKSADELSDIVKQQKERLKNERIVGREISS